MKKTTYALLLLFIPANAVFLSLGLECLLNLLGLVMAVSPDGSPQFPRFIPFCIILSIIALLGLISIFILNVKISEKRTLTKSFLVWEYVTACVLSIPLAKLWEILFDFLQRAL